MGIDTGRRTNRFEKTIIRIVCAATVLSPASLLSTDSPLLARRDQAQSRIALCMHSNDVSSHQCKTLNRDVQTLVDVYKQGDKSVLPTLFQFTYLSDFYDETLLSDADAFLTAMTRLPEKDRRAVAFGVGGGISKIRSKDVFELVRKQLQDVPNTSPTKPVAQLCLEVVETNNASFFVNYFPPQSFAGLSGGMRVRWYSSKMYALREKPLWPAVNDQNIYRLTYIGAFSGSRVITLKVQQDQSGMVHANTLREIREESSPETTISILPSQVEEFFAQLEAAHFWDAATERPNNGRDGAEWLLEGVRDGKYKIVDRWCPGLSHSSEEQAFAETGRLLFALAGYKRPGSC
jgi:hypothetical protein